MDIYDPQTLGIMVFSGFMLISAIGIALVSTFSMKETSYEEALAKQRQELNKTQTQTQRSEKKKKDKALDKRNRGKKKDDKPNGKLPDTESATPDLSESEGTPTPAAEPKRDPSPVPEAVVAPVPTPTPAPVPVVAAPAPAPVSAPAPSMSAPPRPAQVEAPAAPSPKDKKKKEKKVAKVEPAQSQQAAPATPKPVASKPEVVVKEVPVMAVPPVGAQKSAPPAAPAVASLPAKAEEPKAEAQSKKKGGSKKKAEPAAVATDSVDAPLYLPYKALVSTVKSMMFSEGEAQQLIEILSEKAGVGTWHTATQKGDPVAVLKKQLEEREKQLAAEQQDATAAKNRLREMTKELSAEKSKVAHTETRLSTKLSTREQEMVALQARMQASYQDHVAETHKSKAKIQSLQEQLDKGPSAQMVRLQQENSILRDALNQATSQSESKQNAELAKLRQECTKLSKEAGEKSEALQADEQIRKNLEAKVAAAESQFSQLQASRVSSEQGLQRRLEEVSEELRVSQSSNRSLQAQMEQASQEGTALTDLQARVASAEASLQERGVLVDALEARLLQTELEKSQLEDQVGSIHVLLEASQSREEDDDEVQATTSAELEQMKNSLKEKESQVAALEEQLKQLSEMKPDTITNAVANTTEAEQPPGEEQQSLIASLEEKLRSLMEEMESKNVGNAEITGELEQLRVSLKEREALLASLEAELQHVKEEKANVPSQADNTTELEALQNSLSEREKQVASLEEELKQAQSSADPLPDHTAELASLQSSLTERDGLVTSLQQELQKLKEEEQSKGDDKGEFTAFQTETKEVLHSLFPHIDIQTEETKWLQDFAQKAQETLTQRQQSQETPQSTELEEVLGKLRGAEESQTTLQAECEQYRIVLGETEGMLKHLQRSVEDEEKGWKVKVTELQDQLKTALEKVQSLEETAESENTDQLKEQVMLLEAQLEKQLESATSDHNYSEEMTQLKLLLDETQRHLDVAQREAQAQREELSLVREQLSEMTERAQREDETAGPQNGQSEPEVQAKLASTVSKLHGEEGLRLQVSEEFEQAQRTVMELQDQLDLLKASGDAPTSDTEDVAELKERLEKEKKLSKDLGQAATKLQQLLKVSQELLAKEKDTVNVLRDQLIGKVTDKYDLRP
ncbi:ribosome-binding protein 1a isoform X1 [Clupea harengus]|uniref:Ribosome-binding protein 1a isoform X1 n=1 Tax=Clupea harengus TaxID=7950 RepID=A0A6P8GIL1_CLUHA|nr:ribosome-binding protein 1a isoform X1 [Clupea harengus]XP_031434716.1 ribosome-binding protein 1a isoform X1 [Clupea harengus]